MHGFPNSGFRRDPEVARDGAVPRRSRARAHLPDEGAGGGQVRRAEEPNTHAWNGAALPRGRWRPYEGRITGTKRRAGPSLGADTQPAVQAEDAERAELPDHDGNPFVSRRRSKRDGGGRARRTVRREV